MDPLLLTHAEVPFVTGATGADVPATTNSPLGKTELAGDPVAAAATLDRVNYFYPVNDEDLHKHLGTLWFDQKNYAGALREFTAVVALHPLDQADANLRGRYIETTELAEQYTLFLDALNGARRVDDIDELPAAMAAAISSPEPQLLEVAVAPGMALV